MCDLPIQLLLLCDDGVSSPAALVSFSRQKLIAAAEEIKQQAKATKKGGGYQVMSPQCKNATRTPIPRTMAAGASTKLTRGLTRSLQKRRRDWR